MEPAVQVSKPSVRVVGLDEQVELAKDGTTTFLALKKGELATLLDHEIEKVGDKHQLSDIDLDILGTAIATREEFTKIAEANVAGGGVEAHAEKFKWIAKALSVNHGYSKATKIVRFALATFLPLADIDRLVARVMGRSIKFAERGLDNSDNFSVGMAKELLGRILERDEKGDHIVNDIEIGLLGTAAGALDAMDEAPYSEWGKLITDAVRYARLEYGEKMGKRLLAMLRHKLKTARAITGANIAKIDDELIDVRQQLAVTEELAEWTALIETKGAELQRPDGSAFHKLKEAAHSRAIIPIFVKEKMPVALTDAFDGIAHSYVVEHNWASAFKAAKDFESGEVELPYPTTCFEFVVSGKRVCAILQEHDTGPATAIILILTKHGWALPTTYAYQSGRMTPIVPVMNDALAPFKPAIDLIGENIRAISITLEAEVTETTVIRADYKLNRAREKRGKLPLYDYHIISLANRSRVRSLPRGDLDPNREYTHKRLHFRCGHWRHFDEHKTWIKWQLIGDPDLGFVDKHYRL